MTIPPAAIRFDQQLAVFSKLGLAPYATPSSNRGNGSFRRLVRCPNHHKPVIGCDLIDPIWNRDPVSLARIIVFQYLPRRLSPGASGVLKVSHQLPLFGIHANFSFSGLKKGFLIPRHIAHLPIPFGGLLPGKPFAIDVQRIPTLPQQAAHRLVAHLEALAFQLAAQFERSFLGPFDPRHRIAGGGILQQLGQSVFQPRLFFSTHFRPPPVRRTRTRSARLSRC